MADIGDVVKYLGDALSAVFRHLIPGVLALATIAATRPQWFPKADLTKGPWLITLAVLATAVGNVWFAVHRYVMQQFVDYRFWRKNIPGGPTKEKSSDYYLGVADHVIKYFDSNAPEQLRQHIKFRTSAVVLVYITAEILIMGGVLASRISIWQRLSVFAGAVVLFRGAVWQNRITRAIEGKVVDGRYF